MEVVIKQAGVNDYRTIVSIGKIAVEEAHRASCSASDMAEYLQNNYNDDAIKKELGDTANVYHLIYYNGQPAGFSKIIFNSAHAAIPQKNVTKLDRIYVLKEFFNLKLGYQLLSYNMELSKKNNQAGIWLFTWTENQRAVNFYLKAGFTIIGTHQFKVTERHSNPNHHMFLKF